MLDVAPDRCVGSVSPTSHTRVCVCLFACVLQGANASLGERVQAQAAEAADWHGKYQTAQADIAALNVKLAAAPAATAPAAAAAVGGDVVARQLLVVVEAERDLLKRNVEVLCFSLPPCSLD